MGEKEEKGDEKPKKGDGEKKGGGGENKKEGGGAGGGDGGGKKEEGPAAVVLKVDMHCEGCAKKIKRSVKGLEGVEGVKADIPNNKLTVLGKADPWKLKERVEAKTRKKVDIISPANPAKKDAGGDAKKPAGGDAKKPDDGKPKAPAASTVVLKIRLHCEGCIQRIRKTILKIKGVEHVSIDALKDLVTVKGTMDVKSLPAILKEKLKRCVEIIQPKKDDGGGGEKKEKGGGGEKKEKGDGGGEKKEKGGGGGGEKKDGDKKDDGEKAAPPPAAPAPVAEMNKMDYYGPYGYRIEMVHAPQMFSDENPNACSIM
ncbi:heavy metal-associated isoprenylated plant protein 3-like [Phoenix dactylifera]|uniref:Heavy metal-associated isoprenylated plant protein 3-like n=1 Tax=Phoenix dactylifera TaxID=42345 RepID=A0A8B9A2Y8_PHODC|nr:heavy metal-associated isoprenylated plant protein 3-like [Phoenix dactylifera]